MSDLSDTLDRRAAVTNRIINALAHLPRDRAMAIILAWISIDDLETIVAPGIDHP